jgi:transcription-repair coupling factor (superfamily II helicase)
MPDSDPSALGAPGADWEIPTDARLLRVSEAAREALRRPGGLPVVGVDGSGGALLARGLLGAGASHVLYVVPNHEIGLRASEDLRALSRLDVPGFARLADEPPPLSLVQSETSPYADVHPDRRFAMQRAAALFTIAKEFPWRVALTTAGGLLRKVAPEEVRQPHGRRGLNLLLRIGGPRYGRDRVSRPFRFGGRRLLAARLA